MPIHQCYDPVKLLLSVFRAQQQMLASDLAKDSESFSPTTGGAPCEPVEEPDRSDDVDGERVTTEPADDSHLTLRVNKDVEGSRCY